MTSPALRGLLPAALFVVPLILCLPAIAACSDGGSREEAPGSPAAATPAGATATPALLRRTPAPRQTATPSKKATPAPSPTATPAPLSFQYGDAVSDGDRAVIKAGVSMASDYADQLAGVEATGVTAYAYVDLSNLSVQWEGVANASGVPVEVLVQGLPRYVGETFPAAIFINTGAAEWRRLSAVEQLRLAAHEYFHTLQMTLVGPVVARAFYSGPIDVAGVMGPNWLLEGSAEYLSWSTLEWLALGDLGARINQLPHDLESPRDLEPFSSFYGVGQPAYDSSLAAVSSLVGEGGQRRLLDYYRFVGYGIAWQSAFLLAFDRSVEDFYEGYEAVLNHP